MCLYIYNTVNLYRILEKYRHTICLDRVLRSRGVCEKRCIVPLVFSLVCPSYKRAGERGGAQNRVHPFLLRVS